MGAAIGGFAGGGAWLAARIVPHPVAAALALGLTLAASGAIHLDGFLDGCDAFFAPVSVERRLAILKDPRCGSFALAGLLAVGSLWYGALLAIPASRYPALLAFAAALARLAAVGNAFLFPAARAGAAPALARRPPALPLAAEGALLCAAAFWIEPAALALVPAAVLLAAGLGAWIARRLGGGLVGDAYGFTIVALEVALLAALSATGPV